MLLLTASDPRKFSTPVERTDEFALAWLILTSRVPFFWLLIHPAVYFWRWVGSRAFWVALPV
jgi:hypothetical protein